LRIRQKVPYPCGPKVTCFFFYFEMGKVLKKKVFEATSGALDQKVTVKF
jgi:hypothetical protein